MVAIENTEAWHQHCEWWLNVIAACVMLIVCDGCNDGAADRTPHSAKSVGNEVQEVNTGLSNADKQLLNHAIEYVSGRNKKPRDLYVGYLSRLDDGRTYVEVALRQRSFGSSCIIVFDQNGDIFDVLEGM